MATDAQRKRYETLFNNFDIDGDDDIDQTDVDAFVQSWCFVFGVPPGSPKWRQVASAANRWWQDLIGTVDSDGNKGVSKDEWVRSIEQPGFIDNVAVPLGLAAFDLCDRDDDGKISREEHVRAATTGRATCAECLHIFSLFDTDGDGYITREEAHQALKDFYKSTEPHAKVNYVR